MKKIIVSTLLSSLLLTNTIFAKSDTEPTSKEVNKNAIEIATKKAENNQVKLIQEALNSLEITAKALKNLNGDNYLLALIVAQRSEQLARGSEPLLSQDYLNKHHIVKPVDIAIYEIAEDKLDFKLS